MSAFSKRLNRLDDLSGPTHHHVAEMTDRELAHAIVGRAYPPELLTDANLTAIINNPESTNGRT
mgnify:CR=1 FL=1